LIFEDHANDRTNLQDIVNTIENVQKCSNSNRMNLSKYSFKNINYRNRSLLKAFMSVLIIVMGIFSSQKMYATHASGSDLTYTWVSGNTFKVTVSFFQGLRRGGCSQFNNTSGTVRKLQQESIIYTC